MTDEWWIGKNLDGNGHGLTEVFCRYISWGSKDVHENLNQDIDISAQIRTENLPDTSLERYR
jgi:hypothetical protein